MEIEEISFGQDERLVIDVKTDDLGIGNVDDRLADASKPECLLGMLDRPGLVEAIDEGAVHMSGATLIHVAAHADISVSDSEQGLGGAHIVGARAALDERPCVDREAIAVEWITRVDGAHENAPAG